MEKITLHHLSLFLDEDIVVIEEEMREHLLSQQLKARHAHLLEGEPESKNLHEEPTGTGEPEEEYREELLKINHEGGFEKGVLILYQGKNLEKSTREFLLKILGAVQCSLKDVALMSDEHLQELPEDWISRENPHKCLVFGTVKHSIMKLKEENYKVVGGEIEILFADDLMELADNVTLKKKLWASLQVLFNVKK